jgi:hypothetical protein
MSCPRFRDLISFANKFENETGVLDVARIAEIITSSSWLVLVLSWVDCAKMKIGKEKKRKQILKITSLDCARDDNGCAGDDNGCASNDWFIDFDKTSLDCAREDMRASNDWFFVFDKASFECARDDKRASNDWFFVFDKTSLDCAREDKWCLLQDDGLVWWLA